MTPREKIHKDKLVLYRKREAAFRARMDKEGAAEPLLRQHADGWARLRAARETIKAQMDDIAERTRRIGGPPK